MPPVPQITVTIDLSNYTYTFSTANPSVTPGSQPLPVPLGGHFTIGSGNTYDGITVVATLPESATVTTPFEPAMDPVGTTYATYQLTAIGMVTLSVPSFGGRPLTGTPLVVAPETTLTLSESGSQTPPMSFGGLVNLFINGLTVPTTAATTSGLFIGEGSSVPVAVDGSVYAINDVDENPYDVTASSQSKAVLVPLVGTINVSSLKKPKAGA